MRPMDSNTIRNQFIEYFKGKAHTYVPSAPVIPHTDATLLFTNAGMNQFKDVFLGTGTRSYKRAVNSQKCIRVSGKHNDLEEVGRDAYHHTFFEMLGTWSFGDYYKQDAITWAWDLYTNVWKLPKEKLYATVHQTDQEAFALWQQVTDIAPDHIMYFGDKENFWEMGDTGPCGPCSEIHIDLGPERCDKQGTPGHTCRVNGDCGRYMELWNLVFIQYNRDASGKLHELPNKHVDTGAGFERICAVLNGKLSNYDTDLFQEIITEVAKLSGVAYTTDLHGMPHRVIADHIRMLSFSIADGALPSNDGRGYVLRRILRRAFRYGRTIGLKEPFLYKLVKVVAQKMGDIFPEIREKQQFVEKIIQAEEASFNRTLDRGLELFAEVAKQAKAGVIAGADVFKLYDTYGFPVDLTAVLAREQELSVDMEGFEREMTAQRERARAAGLGVKSGIGGEIVVDKSSAADKAAMARHHTATHLLHAALQTVLGKHATQAGSLVSPEKLRFDFNHFQAVTKAELERVEQLVNAEIKKAIPLNIFETSFQEAKTQGAMALFGEKYAEKVRVVQIAEFSKELCGGTHVANTAEIGQFKIVSESSVSAGVRRIEAVAGAAAVEAYLAGEAAKTQAEAEREAKKEAQKKLEKELTAKVVAQIPEFIKKQTTLNGRPAIILHLGEASGEAVRTVANSLMNHLQEGVLVLAARDGDKATVVTRVSKKYITDNVSALKLVQIAGPLIQGGGGGKPDQAQSGGKAPAKIPDALDAVTAYLNQY